MPAANGLLRPPGAQEIPVTSKKAEKFSHPAANALPSTADDGDLTWYNGLMMEGETALVHTTLDDAEAARKMAERLVEERLAGCVQILTIRSIYRWKGTVENQEEYLLICKTTTPLAETLATRIKELHPYEVPEIVTYTASSSAEYAAWLEEVTCLPKTHRQG